MDIKINESKIKCTVFYINRDKYYKFVYFRLNGAALVYCQNFKYLGHIFNNDMSDNEDIMRQTGAIYARGNKIVNTFRHCTDGVKCKLFKTYISNSYTAQIWCN